jgi:predicted HTH transcriptional regulator
MIPQQLSDWSIESISEILITGRFETETFDFKEKLPDSKDEKAKERLRKTCCAFANSDGAFIVFGILDDKSKPPEKRLVGLSPNNDFPEHFGNYPRSCAPSIYWTFLNPPLPLPDGNILHIVHIPKSWKAPHATGDSDNGWNFTKRTNKGNEGMGIEEIRSGFLGYYEKRLKLQLL